MSPKYLSAIADKLSEGLRTTAISKKFGRSLLSFVRQNFNFGSSFVRIKEFFLQGEAETIYAKHQGCSIIIYHRLYNLGGWSRVLKCPLY